MEKLDAHGCLKNQELVELDRQVWICTGYTFRHKTTIQYAEQKADLFGEWKKQHLKL